MAEGDASIMTISLVQGPKRAQSITSTIVCTLDSIPTNGNLLIAVVGCSDYSGVTANSIAQTGVNWSSLGAGKQVSKQYNDSGSDVMESSVWVGIIGAGASSTLTITLSTTPKEGAAVDVFEYSGLDTSGFLDKTSTSGANNANPQTGTTATTTQAIELWIGAIVVYQNISYTGGSNGFTYYDGQQITGVTYWVSLNVVAKIVNSTGAASSSLTPAGTSNYSGCICTLKGSLTTPTKTYSLDSDVLKKNIPSIYSLDALIHVPPKPYIFDIDFLKIHVPPKPYIFDIDFLKSVLKTNNTDVSLKKYGVLKTYEIDAMLERILAYKLDSDLEMLNVGTTYGMDVRLGPITPTAMDYQLDIQILKTILKTCTIDTRLVNKRSKSWHIDTDLNTRPMKTYGLDVSLANKQLSYLLTVNLIQKGLKVSPIDVYLKRATVQKTLTYSLDMDMLFKGLKNYNIDYRLSLSKLLTSEMDLIIQNTPQPTYGFDVDLVESPTRTQIKNSGGTLRFYPIEWAESQKCSPAIRDIPLANSQFIDAGTFITETRQIEFTFRATDDEKDTMQAIYNANEEIMLWLYQEAGSYYWVFSGWLKEPRMEFEYIEQTDVDGITKLTRWWKITLTLNVTAFAYWNLKMLQVH